MLAHMHLLLDLFLMWEKSLSTYKLWLVSCNHRLFFARCVRPVDLLAFVAASSLCRYEFLFRAQ